LDATLTGAPQLLLHGVSFSHGLSDKLADDATLDAVAIEPRLLWDDKIVLISGIVGILSCPGVVGLSAQSLAPGFSANGIDFTRADFNRHGVITIEV